MEQYRDPGAPPCHDANSFDERYSTYSSQPTPSSENNGAHAWNLATGATDHSGDQSSRLGHLQQQGGPTPRPQAYHGVTAGYGTNQSFGNPHHVHPTEQDYRYAGSLSDNSFTSGGAGIHSIPSSSASFPSGSGSVVQTPPHPSAANPFSLTPPLQYLCISCQASASTPCSLHLQTSSSPLQGLVSHGQAGTEPESIKLSDGEMRAIMDLFHLQTWFSIPAEEPPVKHGDPFITNGHIPSTARSRFNAFVYSNNTKGGKSHCRIKHYVHGDDKDGNDVECSYKSAHHKEVIAHVCDYLNYRPYKCQGKGKHAACGSTYLTNERRNDHYSKMKKGAEELVPCTGCDQEITRRNLKRHRKTCYKLKKSQ